MGGYGAVQITGRQPQGGPAMSTQVPSPNGLPVLSQVASGTLAAQTYFVRLTFTTASGETLPGPENSIAVLIDNVFVVQAPGPALGANGVVPAGITGYNVYASNTSGTETKQNSSPVALGTAFQEPATGLIAGAALPTVNTTPVTDGRYFVMGQIPPQTGTPPTSGIPLQQQAYQGPSQGGH